MGGVNSVLERMRESVTPAEVSVVGCKHLLADMLYGGKKDANFTISKENWKKVLRDIKGGQPIFQTPKVKTEGINSGPAADGAGLSLYIPHHTPIFNQIKNVINIKKETI